ncbi:MAG: glycosyltransferase family 4 protein [Crenarchaeota archaeon]|nr:glycosyltransferase family 4 protein [Thermoproteota archaeon]
MTKAKDKLHLAVFNTQPPLFLGGVERRILETAKYLKTNVDTTVYSGTKAGLKKVTHLNDVTLVPCLSTDKIFPIDNWTFNQTLYRNASKIRADVYETHTASGYGLIKALKKQKNNNPIIQVVHGVLADEYAQAKLSKNLSVKQKLANILMWQLAKHEEQAANQATLIVTISQYSKVKLLQYYQVDASKIRLIPNGVDTDRFTPIGEYEKIRQQIKLGNRKMVLCVGRLILRKGINYLIEAAKQITKEYTNILFVLVGNGPLRNQLEFEITSAGLNKNFQFLGDVSEEDLPKIYRCADVFVLPSIQEGQGIVLLEAQASGKPVVAFNISGVTEALQNNQTGFLVKPRSSDDLAQVILKLLSDAPLREKMGAKGREFVLHNLSWDITAKKQYSVYKEAIEITKS